MRKGYEIPHNELDIKIDQLNESYNSEDEEDIFVGNGRAREILDYGLELKNQGNNIYISCEDGMNVVDTLKKYLKYKTHNLQTPDDWCYVYNFKNLEIPKALSLPAGEGKVFKKMLDICITEIIQQAKDRFNSTKFKKVENKLKDEFLSTGERKLEQLKDDAKQLGFSTNITDKGIFFIPILNGKKISEEQYDDLTVDEQESILKTLNVMEDKSQLIMQQVKKLKQLSETKVIKLENKILESLIDKSFIKIENIFVQRKKVITYIRDLKEDLLDNIKETIVAEDSKEKLRALLGDTDSDDCEITRYEVNKFIDNSNLHGLPIIYCKNADYYEIFGKIEYENELGIYSTDFQMIKKGILHNANGGYLIIHADNILKSSIIWDTLKKMLFNKNIHFDNIREQLGALPIKTIKPEPIPMDLKVIIIGSENLYRLLYTYDKDFKELFKLHVQMSDMVDRNRKTVEKYFEYFDDICNKHRYRLLSNEGKMRLLKHASYIAQDRNKLSTKFELLKDIISEADICAKHSSINLIDENKIKQAILQRKKRSWMFKEQIHDSYKKEKLLFDSKGMKIGQINGVAVSDYGDYCLARIIRITAITYMGKTGIVNIEKESKLTGAIFDKGIGILSGYIYSRYSQDFPIMLNCQLCFEQVYSTIEGDSASCAELFVILSSIAEVPIDQSIAITGSVDQFGNVQPIGSVSDKIQGCYEAFKVKGITGSQGIIVPIQNVDEIVLDDEVLELIKEGKFHIYAIKDIKQGIEILTGESMETIDDKINKKLLNYYNKNKQLSMR